MKYRISFVVLSVVLLFTQRSQAAFLDGVIDFEAPFPGGVLLEGDSIGTQYEEDYGVRFSLVGGGLPVLVEVGPTDLNVFNGEMNVVDTVIPSQQLEVGQYFLHDDGVTIGDGGVPSDLRVDFSSAKARFGGGILDIEGRGNPNAYEEWTVEIYNSGLGLLDSVVLSANPMTLNPVNGDARITDFYFGRLEADIDYALIRYTGTVGVLDNSVTVGYGIDNLYVSESSSAVPEPGSMALLGIAGFGVAYRRRRDQKNHKSVDP